VSMYQSGDLRRPPRAGHRTVLALTIGSVTAITACGGGATPAASAPPARATVTVTASAGSAGGASSAENAGAGGASPSSSSAKKVAKKSQKAAKAQPVAGSAKVTASGLGACPKSPLAAAGSASGKTPVQYGGKARFAQRRGEPRRR